MQQAMSRQIDGFDEKTQKVIDENRKELDRALLYVVCAGLGFLYKVFDWHQNVDDPIRWLLAVTLVLFVISLFSNLLSYLLSFTNLELSANYFTKGKQEEDRKKVNQYAFAIDIMTRVSVYSLLSGIVFLSIYFLVR